ncbi:MAG: hypothetical protein E7421_01035 [Ruminococcaceae bacterium]|nr:hypothetical protein [Oscillospiraceae bacterium]
MKRRILSFLMALCMVISLLPVTTFAVGPTITVAIPGLDWTDIAEGTHKYATTDAETKTATECGENDNWNIHLDYTTGKTPTLYLNGATLNTATQGVPAISVSTTGAFILHSVEGSTNTITSTVSKYNSNPLYFGAAKGTTVTGTGKLIAENRGGTSSSDWAGAAIRTEYNLTFDHADVELLTESGRQGTITIGSSSGSSLAHCPGEVTFKGGKVHMTSAIGQVVGYLQQSYSYGSTLNTITKNIYIIDGAEVTCSTGATHTIFGMGGEGKVYITNSTFQYEKTSFTTYGTPVDFPELVGTHLVEYNTAKNTDKSFLYTGNSEADSLDADYIAPGTDLSAAGIKFYSYLKISHVHATTGGCTAGGNCKDCGAEVAPKAHSYADFNATICSDCGLARPASVYATIGGLNMNTSYGDTKYATMSGSVATEVDANAEWNIKLDYTGDVAVLSLQNIDAAGTFNLSGAGALQIDVLTDVTITANGAFTLAMEEGTTISSPTNGKLTVNMASTSGQKIVTVPVGTLTFKNANVEFSAIRSGNLTAGEYAGVDVTGDVVFSGGTATITGSGSNMALKVGGDLTVEKGANVTLLAGGWASAADVTGDILVKSADLVARHSWGSPSATKWLFNKVPTAAEDVKAVYSTSQWNYAQPNYQKALTAETDILDWENNKIFYIAFTHTCLVKDCAAGLTCDCGKVTAPAEHTIVGNDGDCTTAEMCEACGMIFEAAADAHSFTNKPSNKVASAATATAPEYCYVQCDNCDAVSNTLKVATGKAPITVAMTGLVWENIEVGTHKYATTDAAGSATECDANADWNIHLDYSDNTPVLYLKSATLNATLDASSAGVPALSVTTSGAFVLNSVAGTTNTLTSAVTHYLAAPMYFAAALGTTVTGTGNLVGNVPATGNSAPAISTKFDLTFKDANVNLTVDGAYRPCIGMAGSGDNEGNLPGLLVIDGGNMVLTNMANGRCIAYMQNTWGQGTGNNSTMTSKTVTIKGGANVQLNGKGNANVIGAAGGVIVEISTLEIIMNAGSGQTGWINAELPKFPQTTGTHLVEYKVASDWNTAKSFLSTNTADADYIAPGTDMTAVDSYLHYLKISHVHNVEGGCTAGGTCVDCGAEVEAKAHSYANFDATVCSDCGTIRPAGLYATISGVEMNTSYGETKYATMDATGAVALVDEGAAWNIKIDYTDDVPVLSLQNITTVAPANTFVMNGEGALVIKNLTDVSITANGACNAFVLGMEGGTTFTSEGESKLTIPFSNNTGMTCVINAKAGSLTFENANIDIDSGRASTYDAKYPAVNAVADVTFIGGTAKILGGGGNNVIEVGGDLVVKNGANVTLLSGGWGYVANVAGDILVKSANLYARHSWGSPSATKWLFNKMPVMADDVSGVYSTSQSNYALPNYQKKLTAETDIWDWENNKIYYIAFTHTCIVDDCTVGGICDCGETVAPQANHVFADIDATNCSVCRFTRLPGLHATISGVNMDTADGEIKYATMDATGAVALVDVNAAWNIKIDFTEDVPVLSLQNITATGASFNLSGKGALQIDVLTDVTITGNNVFTLAMEGGTTITSPTDGKLTVEMSSTSGTKLLTVPVGTLTFENANVAFNAIRAASYTIGEYAAVDVAGDVVFSGGTATITGSGSNMALKVGGDLTVEKGANVTLLSDGYGSAADVTGEIKVIAATLTGRHSWGSPSATKWLFNKIPTVLDGVNAVYSESQWNWSNPAYQKALTAETDILDCENNKIYYIAFAHSCVADDCTEGWTCVHGLEFAAKAAHTFDNNCTTADKCANCSVVTEANATHNLGDLSVTAGACQNPNCEFVNTASVEIFNEGGATKWSKKVSVGEVFYATNDENGVVSETTEEVGDWTIKFEYPVDGVPTLTFKGAKIQGNSTGHGMTFGSTWSNFKVVVLEDSEVNNGTHNCFWATSITGDVIIEGAGKLTLRSTSGNSPYGCPLRLGNVGDAYIQNANLEIIGGVYIINAETGQKNGTRSGIIKTGGNLIIDNSEVNFDNPFGNAIWMLEKMNAEGKVSTEDYKVIEDNVSKKDLIIRNGSVITGTTNSYGFGVSGDLTVADSTVEMTCGNGVFATKPTLEGVTAIGGLSANKTIAYNENRWSMFRYIKIVPGEDVVLVGDINGDGSVNSLDSLVLAKHLADWADYSDIDLLAADVNGDGKVTNIDYVILERHIAGWEGYETLPAANAG